MQLAFKHQLVLQKSTIHRQPQRQLASSRRTVCQAAPQGLAIQAPVTKKGPFKVALLFDCDGVIVDTEQLHRRAYCKSFEYFRLKINGVPVVWDVPYYDILQNTVGGGKPKMKYHFTKYGWPSSIRGAAPTSEAEQSKLIDLLQDKKTEFYKQIVEEAAEARPGVLKLMDEGLANPHVAMAICSAATKEGFEKVVNSVVGPERLSRFDLVLAGDDVSKKKPDPMIYNMAAERLGVDKTKCLVIEDSLVGLNAAKSAGMACIITPTTSSDKVDFISEGAGALLPEGLGTVRIADLFDVAAGRVAIKVN